jgi:class 3 adenylate cyclase
MGFRADKESERPGFSDKPGLLDALRKYLRPELLGRIGAIVLFEQLSRDAFISIADHLLSQFKAQLQAQDKKADFPQAIRQRIMNRIPDLHFGARELEQIVKSEVAAWIIRRGETEEYSPTEAIDAVPSSKSEIVFTTMKPASSRVVALLVLDIAGSTSLVLHFGDSFFNALIGNIYSRFKQHESAAEMNFLKCTGDGFLSVFTTVPAAFSVASVFLESPVHEEVHVRMALHWGEVRTGPDGDVLGVEVHRVCRVEGVKVENQIDPAAYEPLPPENRILATKEVLDRLNAPDQQRFRPAGRFRLKGFDESCKLWVCSDVGKK